MYKYSDRIIKFLVRKFIYVFSNAKGQLLKYDELNLLSYSKSLYDTLDSVTRTYFLKIAKSAYKGASGKGRIEKEWLDDFLLEYNPVTKYVYAHEVERKMARFAEAISAVAELNYIPASAFSKECDRALSLWTRQVKQYGIDIVDRAVIDAYKSRGVEKVMWVTAKDEKVCEDCGSRDEMIYDIDKIPEKPHYNCRCILKPVVSE